jgi:CRISPR type III-A-associated protein Csm2
MSEQEIPQEQTPPEATPSAETPAPTPAAEPAPPPPPPPAAEAEAAPAAAPAEAPKPPAAKPAPQGGPREPRERGPKPERGPRPDRPPREERKPGDRPERSDRGPDRGPSRDRDRDRGPRGDRPMREGPPTDIEIEKLIADSLYLDNQAHAVVSRMRDMDSGTRSQLRRFYSAVRRATRAPESERQHQFVMLRARLAYTIARHQLRSLDTLERLLLQVTRKNDPRGYERFRDLFEAIVAYNE